MDILASLDIFLLFFFLFFFSLGLGVFCLTKLKTFQKRRGDVFEIWTFFVCIRDLDFWKVYKPCFKQYWLLLAHLPFQMKTNSNNECQKRKCSNLPKYLEFFFSDSQKIDKRFLNLKKSDCDFCYIEILLKEKSWKKEFGSVLRFEHSVYLWEFWWPLGIGGGL